MYRVATIVHTVLDIWKLLIEGRGHGLECFITFPIFAIFHSVLRSRHPDKLA